MATTITNSDQGFWILAQVGKKVLRPGGRELTMEMLKELAVSPEDDVIELAPGVGFTAELVLENNPHSYTGVELNEEASEKLTELVKGPNRNIVTTNAKDIPLPNESATCVYGEAMLTMQSRENKERIIHEAHRLLKRGGRYAIHELSLAPDSLSDEEISGIQRDLATAVKVNARPLRKPDWLKLLEDSGFTIKHVQTRPMRLLRAKRLIEDEGILHTLGIGLRILTNRHARKRIGEMSEALKKHYKKMYAIVIIAEKQ